MPSPPGLDSIFASYPAFPCWAFLCRRFATGPYPPCSSARAVGDPTLTVTGITDIEKH